MTNIPDPSSSQPAPKPADAGPTLNPQTTSGPAPPQPSALNANPHPSTTVPLFPGETPRAFSAFIAFFNLGPSRSHQALADALGENPDTVKNWSSKYHWSDRINDLASGRLQQQLEAEAAARRQQAADWSKRAHEYRQQQWDVALKLLAAVQCFLESFGDEQLHKMTLGQVSRAFRISSDIACRSLTSSAIPEPPPLADIQIQLLEALKRGYGPATPPASGPNTPSAPPATST